MDRISLSTAAIRKIMDGTNVLPPAQPKPAEDARSFGAFLTDSMNSVNSRQIEADNSISNLLAGRGEGIHETMLAVEKADIAMRLLVKVRNKAVEAYRDIMRMQV